MLMQNYVCDEEIYIARIVTGMNYIHSELDHLSAIEEHLKLVPILKRINPQNIDEIKIKGSWVEEELYKQAKKHLSSRSVSFGYVVDIAISALHANEEITSYDLSNLLSDRLHYTKSGLYQHQVQEKIERYFFPEEVITRKKLNNLTNFLLNNENPELLEEDGIRE